MTKQEIKALRDSMLKINSNDTAHIIRTANAKTAKLLNARKVPPPPGKTHWTGNMVERAIW